MYVRGIWCLGFDCENRVSNWLESVKRLTLLKIQAYRI